MALIKCKRRGNTLTAKDAERKKHDPKGLMFLLVTLVFSFTISYGQNLSTQNNAFLQKNSTNNLHKEQGMLYNLYDGETKSATLAKGKGGKVTIPRFVKSNGIKYDVTEIEPYAFKDTNLKEVFIRENIRIVGEGAFYGCKKLRKVYFIEDRSFENQTKIGRFAFANCISLENVALSYNVSEICSGAFEGCNNLSGLLKSISVKNKKIKIRLNAIPENVRVTFFHHGKVEDININRGPDNCYDIDGLIFSFDRQNLTASVIAKEEKYTGEINIPNSIILDNKEYCVNSIGEKAFSGSDITSIKIPNSVVRIGNGAFEGCSHMKSLDIPNGVEHIGNKAFYICQNLRHINIPISVKFIGDFAFQGCNMIFNVVIPNKNVVLGQSVFGDYTIVDNSTNVDNKKYHQVYDGDYKLFGEGNARYQYINGPNGSRIFDGHFIFHGKNGGYAEGNFNNNHQVGEWIFENSPIGYVRISFDENNRTVSGTFVHRYDIYGDNLYCHAEGKFMRADDGHLYGPMIYGNKTKRKNRITYIKYINKVTDYLYGEGEYNMDGKEKGKWSYGQGKGERHKSINAEYDNNGNLLESYYIESSTGEKIRWGVSSISDYIRRAVDRHWEVISSFFLRSTEEYY